MELTAIILGLAVAASSIDDPLSAEDLLTWIDFEPEEQASIIAGEILTRGMPRLEQRDDQLVALLAMHVKIPLDETINIFAAEAVLLADPRMLDYGEIRNNSDFSRIHFAEHEGKELRRLRKLEPDDDFNFSAGEISRFNLLAKNSNDFESEATALYREILRERLNAYKRNGLDGVEGYMRDFDEIYHLGPAITTGSESLTLLRLHYPEFYRNLREFPNVDEDVVHRYFWKKKYVEKRPAMVLDHMMIYRRDNYAIVSEREFYVGHTYNGAQFIVGMMEWENGTLVILLSQTFTERVAGFMSRLSHAIGRNIVQKTLRNFMTKMTNDLVNGEAD